MPTPNQSYPGYVYLIGSSQFGWFKIGKSIRPEIRVSDLGVMLPFKIELFALWGTFNHSFLESALHDRHAAKRLNGEWFCFDLNTLVEIIGCDTPYPATQVFGAIPGNPPRNIEASLIENKKAKRLYARHFHASPTVHHLRKHDLYLSKMRESLEMKGLEDNNINRRIFKAAVKPAVRKLLRHGDFEPFKEALDKACYDFLQD
jgi:Meiotically up-regulated gene 113